MERDVPPQGEASRPEPEHLESGEEERTVVWTASILARMGTADQAGEAQ